MRIGAAVVADVGHPVGLARVGAEREDGAGGAIYHRDGDGWRETPEGRPLTLVMASMSSQRDRLAKARTAALMKRDTKLVEEMVNGGRTAFLSAPGLDGQLEGGVAIVVDGQCIGAVGVSGVKAMEDAEIATIAIAAWRGEPIPSSA